MRRAISRQFLLESLCPPSEVKRPTKSPQSERPIQFMSSIGGKKSEYLIYQGVKAGLCPPSEVKSFTPPRSV